MILLGQDDKEEEGRDGKFDIGWVTDPPIKEIKEGFEFKALCQQFKISTKAWTEPWEKLREQLKAAGADKKVRKEAKKDIDKWNMRIYDGKNIAKWAATRGVPFHREKFFVYMCFGKPIGLMVTMEDSLSKSILIDYLATHPGSESGGGILIEHAANLSEKAGYQGRLTLASFVERATSAYIALGFSQTSLYDMELVPIKSNEKWVKLDGRWRLLKYQNRKTFAF